LKTAIEKVKLSIALFAGLFILVLWVIAAYTAAFAECFFGRDEGYGIVCFIEKAFFCVIDWAEG
jgi:uncharacterized membrane protein YhdT